MLIDTIVSRSHFIGGFVGVTLMPSIVQASETASQPVQDHTTLIFQAVIAVVTVLTEVFKFFSKRKADKLIINSQNQKNAVQ